VILGEVYRKHMAYFNFINIACPATRAENGRVYDPQAGAFLIPDPYVQEPHNPSNYNRYSYVLNNPLKYTDPSGYKFLAKINPHCRPTPLEMLKND